MKKHFAPKRKQIKNFWVVSYLAVFLLPLFVGMIAGVITYNSYSHQVKERNSIVLNSVCNTIDDRLEKIVTASMNLYGNDYVNKVGKSFSLPISGDESFTLYNFTNEFGTMRGYDDVANYTDCFYIYFPQIESIVGFSTVQKIDTFYKVKVNKNTFTYEEWESFIKKKHGNTFENKQLFSNEDELIYINTLQLSVREDKYVNIISKINTDKILDEIKNLYLYEHGNFLIIDKNGKVLMTTRKDVNNVPADKKNTLSFKKISESTGWTYIYSIPENVAYGNLYKILISLVVLYLLCLIGGLWLINYFIKRNYRPINALMTLFPGNERNLKEDEFSYLNEKISESLSHNMALNQELDTQTKMIRIHLIDEMLLGREMVGRRSKTELEKLQIDVENKELRVLIYSISAKDAEELSMKQIVLTNVTDELLTKEGYNFISTKKENDIIYIFNTEDEFSEEKIKEIAQFLLSFTRKEFDFEFYSALGSGHNGARGVGKSYSEAKRAVEFSIASGETSFMKYEDISSSINEGYFYTMETEAQLVNLIKANEQKKVLLLLEKIYSRNLNKNTLSIDSVRYLTGELFGTVKKLMVQYGHNIEEEYPKESLFIENISESRDIEKMQQVIYTIYEECCKNVFAPLSHKDDLIEGVTLYINQNYSDQNLSIRSIGEAFSMNAEYMSRKFREYKGKSVNEYLRDVRIEKAKELLRSSDELIADIAEMVGFTSYRTFVRVFTEVVGVTPNKFKMMK